MLRRPTSLLLLAATLAVGCRGGDPGLPTPATATADTPERIITMAPSVAEVLHALELGDKIVGVGDYVNWPPELAGKPRLGGLFNPDFERIVGLGPDLAILLTSEESLRARLESVGIEVMTVPSETLGDVELAIETIAEACGVVERGEAFLRQWRQDLAPEVLAESLRVAMVIGREPQRLGDLLVAGPGTFYHQLLGKIGARNVFGDVDTRYPQIGIEEILARRPDAVLEIQPLEVPESRAAALTADWSQLAGLTSASPRCIEIVAGEKMMIPGPRLPEVLIELRRALERCISRRS